MTMETKFTGGKWGIDTRLTPFLNNRTAIMANSKKHSIIEDYTMNKDERNANAKLVAAAPDMYNAIHDLLNDFGMQMTIAMFINQTPNSSFLSKIDNLRAAIKKATE